MSRFRIGRLWALVDRGKLVPGQKKGSSRRFTRDLIESRYSARLRRLSDGEIKDLQTFLLVS